MTQIGHAALAIFVILAALVAVLWIACLKLEVKHLKNIIQPLKTESRLLHEIGMEIRDTWDHLPRFIPMHPNWASAAQEIGWAVPLLLKEIQRSSLSISHQFTKADFSRVGKGPEYSCIAKMVEEIDDPILNNLWRSCRMLDLIAILRLALFKTWEPGFDLSAFYQEPTK